MTTTVELFAPPRVQSERRPDGTVLLSSREPLGEVEPSMVSAFRSRAERDPDRRLVAQRGEDGSWVELSYGEARERADSLGQALLEQGLGPEHPLLVLSGNSIDHLVATLACYTARVPVIPLSVAYSLASRDHARIREIVALCRPKMVFAEDARAFGAALDAVGDVQALVSRNHSERPGALVMSDLATDGPGGAIEQAAARVTPDTVAKVLFTSGSTGSPKGVINTHRMLCSNQQMLAQIWPFVREEPPVLVDWLPWSHTFGGNHNVGLVLTHGGTLYIDDGKPAPGLFERTLANLREIQPTVYFNVPAGYAQLVPQLEADPGFAESFLSRMRFLFYAAASLPEDLWDRLRALVSRFAEREVAITSSWGSTETAPAATSAHFSSASCGCIGVPLPGVALKLIPDGDRFEIRVAGPNVTPGYLDNPEATSRAFDEDGYYRSGDAVRFVDLDRPEQGLRFDGRVSEDFKLTSGTWVTVGRLRSSLLSACGGVLSDAVIAGHDNAYVGALAWINQPEARRVCGGAADVAPDDEKLRAHLAQALAKLNAGAGSAARIERLLLLPQPPDLDAGEITDKGYINQRAVLERRAGDVDRLFAEPPPGAIVVPGA